MYWNGVKEVTKKEVRDIFESELKCQEVKELWTTNPTDFENKEIQQFMVVVTDNEFDSSVIDICYSSKDLSTHLPLWDVRDVTKSRKLFEKLTCVYKGGVWLVE